MASRSVVIRRPCPHSDRRLWRDSEGHAGARSRRCRHPRRGRARRAQAGGGRDRGDGQCHSGRGQDESRPPGGGSGRPAGDGPGHDREPRLRLGGASDRVGRARDPPRRRQCRCRWRHGEHGSGALPRRRAVAGAIDSATGSFTTACSATGSTTPSPANTQAGIPKTWWRNIRSRAKPRTNGLCARNSASHARRPPDISRLRSRRSRSPAKKGRRHSTRTKPIGRTPPSKRWRD